MSSFSASVWKEGDIYVAQCLDLDLASQGETEDLALAGLKEAILLHYMPPVASLIPKVTSVEVEVGAA